MIINNAAWTRGFHAFADLESRRNNRLYSERSRESIEHCLALINILPKVPIRRGSFSTTKALLILAIATFLSANSRQYMYTR